MSLIYQLVNSILRDNFDEAKDILKKSRHKDVLRAKHEIDNPLVVPIDYEVQARLETFMKPINDELFGKIEARQSHR